MLYYMQEYVLYFLTINKLLEEYFKSIWMYSCELITFTEEAKSFYIKNWYELLADYVKKYYKNDKYTRRVLLTKLL